MSKKTHHRNLPIPFFSQREVTYAWQRHNNGLPDSASPRIPLAHMSCNIVSLCMLLHYYGITDDSPYRMMQRFFETTGFFDEFINVSVPHDFRHEQTSGFPDFHGANRMRLWWALRQFPNLAYSVPTEYIKQVSNVPLSVVEQQISKGNPVMFSYAAVAGSQTYRGHIAVIRGFTDEGHVIINDPWGDVATPDGFLIPTANNQFAGRFYSNTANNRANFFGLGNGDNSVVLRNEFKKLIQGNHTLFQAIYIEYPHIWSFPFRQGASENTRGTTFRFTEPLTPLENGMAETSEDRIVRMRLLREEQTARMLEAEVIENAGFPISTNRMWHDGIHITGNGSVYAIGPGRLVAARIQPEDRMPGDGGSSNFVLVRHRIIRNKKEREFYSYYLHLAPVDLANRIMEQLGGSAEEWNRDWIDQLIERIKPKRAIINSRNVQAFRRNGQTLDQPVNLPLGALIYLQPADEDVRRRVENISHEEELQQNLSQFYNAVNNINTYVHRINGTEYLAYYHRTTGAGNRVTWETRYVLRNDNVIIPQVVNIPDFIYSRRKLARLLRGDVTTFAKEKINERQIEKINNIRKYRDTYVASFSNVNFGTLPGYTGNAWSTVRTTMHNRIREHCRRLIPTIQRNEELLNEVGLLAGMVCEFGRTLLSIPASLLDDPRNAFTLNGEWYGAILRLYREILELFAQRISLPYSIDEYENCVRATMISSVRANIDYHIEVNGNTKLGMPYNPRITNRSRNANENRIIHFEIFSSEDDMLSHPETSEWNHAWGPASRRFVRVEKSKNRNDFFNVRKIITSLRDSNFLKERRYFPNYGRLPKAWILPREIENFLRDSLGTGENISLQYAVVYHLHSYATLSNSIWENIVRSGIGMNSILPRPENMRIYLAYKWLSEEIVKELKPLRGGNLKKSEGAFAYFYHPVRFLAQLDEYLFMESNTSTP